MLIRELFSGGLLVGLIVALVISFVRWAKWIFEVAKWR
jgi:hypothetical protein